MDGAFACPECGSSVEVTGLAPGRQVRCGFCDRLLEVPFLPRAADAPWRRRRFGRPKWLVWAWAALAVVSTVILGTAAFQFVSRQYRSAQQRPINHLLDSSRVHEANGRLDQALIDLDTALEVARKAGPQYIARLDKWRKKRPDLALRDAQNAVDRLRRIGPLSFSLGNWLNLIARAERDPDLEPLRRAIDKQFQAALNQQIDFELAAARRSFASGQVVSSMNACDRIPRLIDHLAADRKSAVRKDTGDLAMELLSTHGAILEPPHGRFVSGSQSYTLGMVPVVFKALEAKNYLPLREASPWRHEWKHAIYRVTIEVTELREGNYMSSANRLTRIEVRLTLSVSDRPMPIFQTLPTARSRMPLPKLPVYLSNRMAMSGEQSAEIEKLLYDDARGQIDEKLAYQLSNMPGCPKAPAAGGR